MVKMLHTYTMLGKWRITKFFKQQACIYADVLTVHLYRQTSF